MKVGVRTNNVIELIVCDNCEFEDFYSFAERLSKVLSVHLSAEMNDFDSLWMDFNYQGNELTLHYNVYFGISVYLHKGNKASKEETEILYTIKNIFDDNASIRDYIASLEIKKTVVNINAANEPVKQEDSDCPKFAWVFMLCIGLIDLLRGFLHTVLLKYSASHFAQLDLSSSAGDQLQLLGAFGISNWLTGALFIIIALKARRLVPYALFFILLAYAIGFVFVTPVAQATAKFEGKYFMQVYLFACLVALCATLLVKFKHPPSSSHE